MKKLVYPGCIFFLFLAVGFSFFPKKPVPLTGIYASRLQTLTYFDLLSPNYDLNWNLAELSDAKPEDLEIDFAYESLKEVKFGLFKFGNNSRQVRFMMGLDTNGYWTDFYLDQNLDSRITAKEKLKGFQTSEDSYKGFRRRQALSLIPVPLRIGYKGVKDEILADLHFFIIGSIFQKQNLAENLVGAFTASVLSGEMRTLVGKKEQTLEYRIFDADGNGCFNDYGKDLIYWDLDKDGLFKKAEGHKLEEYFVVNENSRSKKQMRLVLLPYPGKIAVTEAFTDFNSSELEVIPTTANFVSPTPAPTSTMTPPPPNQSMESPAFEMNTPITTVTPSP